MNSHKVISEPNPTEKIDNLEKFRKERKKFIQDMLYNEEVEGEKRVSKISFAFSLIMLIISIIDYFLDGRLQINMIFNWLCSVIYIIYRLIMIFLLRKNRYKIYYKYLTIFMGLLTVTALLLGFALRFGIVHSLRTIVVYAYFIVIALCAFYLKPKLVMLTGVFVCLIYSSLFLYTVLFTDSLFTKNETFNQPGISYIHPAFNIPLFLIVSYAIAYICKRMKILLNRSLLSEMETKFITRVKQSLEEANVRKTNFFINVAHETKTPLTLIRNHLDKYIKEYGKNKELLVIKQNMDKLIQDMLNFMQAENLNQGKLSFNHASAFNFSCYLKQKLSFFKEILHIKDLVLKYDIEENVLIQADPRAIECIMNNILDNAFKYNREKGEITVRLETLAQKIFLTIRDTGIGISRDNLPSIFTPYYQVTQLKKNYQGMGMGLAIVKNITEAIGATIEFESVINQGSSVKFTFNRPQKIKQPLMAEDTLPISKFNRPTHLQRYSYDPGKLDPVKANILLVEDNQQLVSYLKEELEPAYNFFYAFDGRQALELLKQVPRPDLIISDIMMDHMDGFEFREKLCQSKMFDSVPFIFLSAKSEVCLESVQNGAIDFISKPFSLDILKAKIESILMVFNQYNQQLFNDFQNFRHTTPALSNLHAKRPSFDEVCHQNGLTESQKELVKLVLQGKGYKEIAFAYNRSEKTIINRMQTIRSKLNVRDRMELINLFFDLSDSP